MTAEPAHRPVPALAFALAEQAAFALANLAPQLLLARAAAPEVFGAYVLAASFHFLAAIAHQTCLVEPMVVFSAGWLNGARAPYHRALLRGVSLRFTLAAAALALTLALLAAAWGEPNLARALAAQALAAPLICYLWLWRRIAFVLGRADLALGATLVHGALTLGLAGAAFALGALTPALAVLCPAAGAAGGVALIAARLRWPPATTAPPPGLRARHLAYGRPALGAEAAAWALTNGPVLILPLAAAAEFRLIGLAFMPLLQAASVASLLLLRHLAQARGAERRTIRAACGALAGLGALHSLAVALILPWLAPRLFGPGYALTASLLGLAGFGATCLVAAQPFVAGLRARERTRAVLGANLAALVALTGLAPIALPFGLAGLVAAQAAASAVALAALALAAHLDPAPGAAPPTPASEVLP